MVKHLPGMWETQVPSLGWEDPLEEEMATHSSILAWRIPWMEESGGLHTVHGVSSQTQLRRLLFPFKILCCHDDTWFHLNLTFLKP